ncbi:MAG: helix-turn-helix transcriptional regulator [Dongiaceae bacterium]|jgi:transcriptional regulator with XRE-family HTH domain
MPSDREKIAAKLKEAREYLGLSQQEVAEAMKLPRSAISLVETAQRGVESVELKAFAKLYQRPVGFFTGEETVPMGGEVAMLAKQVAKLSPQDRDELLRFSEYLVQRSKAGS